MNNYFEENLNEAIKELENIKRVYEAGKTRKDVLEQSLCELIFALDHLKFCSTLMECNKPLYTEPES